MVFRRTLLAVLVLSAMAVAAAPAQARAFVYGDMITLAGSPTPEEAAEIDVQWQRLMMALPAARRCVAPLTVVVVDSAEVAWGGGISGIAAFYRRSQQTVYVEHGKVRAEHLIHEFAHHVDFSCGFGASVLGTAFLEAQHFDTEHAWASGSGWRDVPAEHFAEAVIAYLEIDSVDLPVTADGLALIDRFAASGVPGSVTQARLRSLGAAM